MKKTLILALVGIALPAIATFSTVQAADSDLFGMSTPPGYGPPAGYTPPAPGEVRPEARPVFGLPAAGDNYNASRPEAGGTPPTKEATKRKQEVKERKAKWAKVMEEMKERHRKVEAAREEAKRSLREVGIAHKKATLAAKKADDAQKTHDTNWGKLYAGIAAKNKAKGLPTMLGMSTPVS